MHSLSLSLSDTYTHTHMCMPTHTDTQTCMHTQTHKYARTHAHKCAQVKRKEEGKPFFGIKLLLLRLQGFALTTELNRACLLTLTCGLWLVGSCAVCVCTAALFHVHRQWTYHPVGTTPSLATARGMWTSTTCNLGNTADPSASLWVSETQQSVPVRIKKV